MRTAVAAACCASVATSCPEPFDFDGADVVVPYGEERARTIRVDVDPDLTSLAAPIDETDFHVSVGGSVDGGVGVATVVACVLDDGEPEPLVFATLALDIDADGNVLPRDDAEAALDILPGCSAAAACAARFVLTCRYEPVDGVDQAPAANLFLRATVGNDDVAPDAIDVEISR